MRVLGAVLAGGAARRFGSDKALALWRGRPLLDHATDLLARHADAVVIAGGTREGYVSIADRPVPGLGPLGGLCGALAHAADHGFGAVLTVPCDTPDLSDSLMVTLRGHDAAAYLVSLPVAGCWPTRLHPALATWLGAGGDRSMRAWAAICGALPVETDLSIRNINRVEDLS